ncbi:MAG: hypothetical protein IKW20_06575 [Bacteroidales bacterium]|nr:hypothetical protein [Bacteroidales bacterium]
MSNELMIVQEQPAATLVEVRRDNNRFPRLHSYPADIAVRMMAACVLRAARYFDADVKMDEVHQTAFDLYTELMADVEGLRTYNLTFEEICRSIRKAATGQSVEYYGRLSFHFLYKCIMSYVKEEVLEANRQMLRSSEADRIKNYSEKVALVTGSHTRRMLENQKP